MPLHFKPGSLVELRNRPWVVLPSEDKDVLLLKPLGGADDEITGIYMPLGYESDIPKSFDFVKPGIKDLGDFRSARLLYNACRLSFRSASGPFRCIGKLSFRPRAYQMVPLIMALRQEMVRLLIADDVGIGKTIEGLLIAKELYDRKEIRSFAVICLPHLCDQWQEELKNKFGIEAVIIRSGSTTALERQIRTNENIFEAFPFQVISIDYIKTESKRQIFIDHCPELLIVDEAHTCAKPAGANHSQQLRHSLLNDISIHRKPRHIVLLTATPHSGKSEEFQSLLGLLKPEFSTLEITRATETDRKVVASHFVQRRRADIIKWMGEETVFPERISEDLPYAVGTSYANLFNEILAYAREITSDGGLDLRKQRYNYWDALALLRGVMSSPVAGSSMLRNKAQKKKLTGADDTEGNDNNDDRREAILERETSPDDNLPIVGDETTETPVSETRRLLGYALQIDTLCGLQTDNKAKEAVIKIRDWLDRGLNPIIFCRYIQTAKYLGDIFKETLSGKNYKKVHMEVITSELSDDLRKEKIGLMNQSERRLLIATDCLSEGINLQEGFNALLHYDLPWNPNRLEQREGRIDRFGQKSKFVEIALLYGNNNPIDGVVLEVLLRKAREIRKAIGISIPFPENSSTVMEAVMNAVLLKPTVQIRQTSEQLTLFEADEITEEKQKVTSLYEEATNRELLSRSIFAQKAIKAQEIEHDLKEIDEAIGNVKTVENFVVETLRYLGVQVEQKREGYKVVTANIPQRLREYLTAKPDILISFKSPTPDGYKYIGRNHPFTEHLTQTLINKALHEPGQGPARAAVMRTTAVEKKTVMYQFRVRNVIAEQPTNRELVAEEMWLWGYIGEVAGGEFLDNDSCRKLMMEAVPSGNVLPPEQEYWLSDEIAWVTDEKTFRTITDPIATGRAEKLVESHTRVRRLLKGNNFKVVEPVLPMDVMGIYILLPETK